MTKQMCDAFRLSPKQERLWSLGQRSGKTPYVAQCVALIEGPLDPRALKENLLKIVEQHEILRTNFRYWPEMKIPVQTIAKAQIAWAEPCQLQQLGAEDQQLELERLIDRNRVASFDFEQGPVLHAQLVEFSPLKHHLILTLPALCADSQTLGSLVRQIAGNMLQVADAGEPPLQYSDISQWCYDTLETEEAQSGRQYWRNQYIPRGSSFTLPFEKRVTNEAVFRPQVINVRIADDLTRKIAGFESHEGVSLPVLFLSCWRVLLWRLTRQSPLQIGLACNGRSYLELEEALGLLTTHVPTISAIDASATGRDIFQDTAARMNEAWKWQDCFTWNNTAGVSSDSSLSFFPICFEFNKSPASFVGEDTKVLIQKQYACIDQFKVKLSCVRALDSLVTEFHYNAELFDSEGIQCLASRFQTLLASMLAEPGESAGTWEILSEVEQEALVAYNATAEEFPDSRCFQQLFEVQVELSPDALALSCGDEQFSYAQLNAAANNVAHHLFRYGIGPESRVALCLERSPLMVIAMLGTLKAGAAYLPLDTQAPARRLRFILEDAQASAVLTEKSLCGLLPKESAFPVWCLGPEIFPINGEGSENPSPAAHRENLAYVIYTSGSTGNPKGVMIDHRGLMNYLMWAQRAYRIDNQTRTLVHSPFSFDLTITGLLLPLIGGGRVELVAPDDELERLCDALANSEQHYSLIKLTPSHLQLLNGWLDQRQRSGRVDALIIGGEALPGDLLNVWQQQSPATRLVNEYGPTETVVGCSSYEIPVAACNTWIPIGRPISNMQMYILDEEMRQLPPGTTAEICIGGEGVARGYLANPALTAERFVPDPFSAAPGKRLYRSGDLGRMRADGEMEYLGRMDEQVKVKGFRIELGEIESVLRQHHLVKDSAVALHETSDGKMLLGYVVLVENNGAGGNPKQKVKKEIREYLKGELPEYMVPKDIVVLKRMPLTPNGKIDRKSLPLPGRQIREADESHAEHLSPVAKLLGNIWCELLSREHVEVDDNFFALGGDSIIAVQIAFKAKQMGISFHPMQLFRYPTIAQLENVIRTASPETVTRDHTEKLPAASGQQDQAAVPDFPLANLKPEKLDQIVRKAAK